MNIDQLSDKLNIEKGTILVQTERLNREYNLGIEDFSEMNEHQTNIIRATLDEAFLVHILGGTVLSSKYKYQTNPDFFDLQKWVKGNNLYGWSTQQISVALPDNCKCKAPQAIAAAMKKEGYYIKMTYLEGGKQGRRWFNDTKWQTPSFM